MSVYFASPNCVSTETMAVVPVFAHTLISPCVTVCTPDLSTYSYSDWIGTVVSLPFSDHDMVAHCANALRVILLSPLRPPMP